VCRLGHPSARPNIVAARSFAPAVAGFFPLTRAPSNQLGLKRRSNKLTCTAPIISLHRFARARDAVGDARAWKRVPATWRRRPSDRCSCCKMMLMEFNKANWWTLLLSKPVAASAIYKAEPLRTFCVPPLRTTHVALLGR